MSVTRDQVADDDFIPFKIRPEIRECTICGHRLEGEVAGLWPNMHLKTCSAWRCNKIASTFLSLTQDVAMANAQAADRDERIQKLSRDFKRRGDMLEEQMEWRKKMLRRRFALKVLIRGGKAYNRKVWGP